LARYDQTYVFKRGPVTRAFPATQFQRVAGYVFFFLAMLLMVLGLLLWETASANAQKIENEIAVFAALDKVTARISHLEVKLGESEKFRALKITPRICYTRPPTEPPLTSAFVEVDEIKLDGSQQRIFTGWMFAQSPGLHGVEHPVFDVWLTSCKTEAPGKEAGNPRKSPRLDSARSRSR